MSPEMSGAKSRARPTKAGALVGGDTWAYGYDPKDAENRLVKITPGGMGPLQASALTFSYDGTGRWLAVGYNGGAASTFYQWCGDELCGVLNAANTGENIRYYAEGETRKSGASLGKRYFARDRLGSARDFATLPGSQSDAMAGAADYDSYGQVMRAVGRLPDHLYAGMYYLPQASLYLTRHRAYDPATARWLSRDPIEEAGGVNLYGYVGVDPVNRVDPLGLYCIFSDGVIMKLIPTSTLAEHVQRRWQTVAAFPVPSSNVPSPTRGFPWPDMELMWQITQHEAGIVERLYKTIRTYAKYIFHSI